MPESAAAIIKALEEKFPSHEVTIKHLADKQLGAHVDVVNQYIFGVTALDPMGNGSYDRYKDRVASDLNAVHGSLEFLAWTFEDYEKEDLTATLLDLTHHYQVDVDVERLISKAGLKGNPTGEHFLLVVAINQIKIVKAAGQ